MPMRTAARWLRHLLESVTIFLLIALATIVVAAVGARYLFNSSLPWYDEIASVGLAWITYFGAALAALRRSHLGFSGFMLSLRRGGRVALFLLSEAVVYAVLISLTYAGWYVLRVMADETLVSLDWVSLQVTQSVLPIGLALFVLAQVLSTPEAWARVLAGRAVEADEIEQEIAKAEAGLAAGDTRPSQTQPKEPQS